jgi:hypothetical protein
MRMLLTFLSFFIFLIKCEKSTDSLTTSQNNTKGNTNNSDDFVYFYLSDSLGNIKTQFPLHQDIIFHFGIINNRDSTLHYTKGHSGPPAVSFHVYHDDTLFGFSDEGYAYPAVVLPGAILPGDTLINSVSWKSNPYHQNTFKSGRYSSTIYPYIWFDDFNIYSYLDTIDFEIK